MTHATRWPFAIVAAATVVVVAGLLSAISATPGRPAPSLLDRHARTYVRLLGEFGALEPAVEVEGARATAASTATLSFAQIAAQADAARAALEQVSAGPAARREHLLALFDALAARASQLDGRTLSWTEELQRMYKAAPPALTVSGDAREARARLEAILPGTGDPAERLAVFDLLFMVPTDKLPIVFERALAECRLRTLKHLSLPRGDVVSVSYVQGAPWSGFSRYLGLGVSEIAVNQSLPLTVDRALELACHEGYPGHHAFSAYKDAKLPAEWPERDLAPTHSPDAYRSEALASWAADLVFSPEERLAFERDILFPIAGLNPDHADRYLEVVELTARLRQPLGAVVARYLAGELDFIQAGWALKSEALMAHPGATLQFVNQYRAYALSYTAGRDALTPLLGRHLPEEVRWENYRTLVTGGI